MTAHYHDGLATVLRGSELDTHPELPDDWSRTMGDVLAHGGPWECWNCPGPSYRSWRCSRCGVDLVD